MSMVEKVIIYLANLVGISEFAMTVTLMVVWMALIIAILNTKKWLIAAMVIGGLLFVSGIIGIICVFIIPQFWYMIESLAAIFIWALLMMVMGHDAEREY